MKDFLKMIRLMKNGVYTWANKIRINSEFNNN